MKNINPLLKSLTMLTCAFIFLILVNHSVGKNWSAWRGADATGSVEGKNYPSELNLNKNLIWKSPLPGKGCSTPIVWEN